MHGTAKMSYCDIEQVQNAMQMKMSSLYICNKANTQMPYYWIHPGRGLIFRIYLAVAI